MQPIIRLTLVQQASGDVEIESAERIEGAPAPLDQSEILPGETVRMLDALSDAGDVLKSYLVEPNLPTSVSYPTGDRERPFGRVDIPTGFPLFVNVPDRPEYAAIDLVELSFDGGAKAGFLESTDATDGPTSRRHLSHFDLDRDPEPEQ